MPPKARPPATPEAESEPEYTVDEISALSKIPSRTIRFYQSRGALMPPVIRGRVAYYGLVHVERLKLIAQLQDRGLRIDAIRDLTTNIDKGETDLAEWLGVEQEVQASWANDHPRTLTESELYDLAGNRRPGLLSDLIRAKLVERRGDRLLLSSPALLGVAMKLEASGIDLGTAVAASEILRKHLVRATAELVERFMKSKSMGEVDADHATMFQVLRTNGIEAVRIMFGREMERQMRNLLESGKLAKLPARGRKR